MGKTSRIYDLLVQSNEDVVGALAYALYKQHKIAYLHDFQTENGRDASDSDLREFNRLAHLPQTLNGYREQAERLVTDFLDNALADKLEAVAEEVVGSTTVVYVQQARDIIQADLRAISATLSAGKGLKGWIKDVATNVLVGVATVVLVGLAAVGIGALDTLNAAAKAAVAQQPTQK